MKTRALNRLCNLIPSNYKANLLLYKTPILLNLTYCHIVFRFCKASDRRKLKRVQERALRAVYNSKTATYEELLNMAKLPIVYNRRLQHIAIMMYKVNMELVPNYILELFDTQKKGYNVRDNDFNVQRHRTTFEKHSIKHLGPYM